MAIVLVGCNGKKDEEESQNYNDATTHIMMKFNETEIYATLDNSETSQEFIERLPLTIEMNRYDDREYYTPIESLSKSGKQIEDYENGDVTYYTTGKSLAIFFGKADTSSQSNLIRMGHITSDLSIFNDIEDHVTVTISIVEENTMNNQDFSKFTNVEITGIDIAALNSEQQAVLYQQARYCQAMSDADTKTMSEMVPEDRIFTHMSGHHQTRKEYFADIEDGSLRYFTIGIENPVITIDGKYASIYYTSVLNANAYGARGTYRIEGTHWYEKRDGMWYSIDDSNK